MEGIRSLILMRTPEYEFVLDETERGVKVSDEALLDDEDDMLENINIALRIAIQPDAVPPEAGLCLNFPLLTRCISL